MMKDLGLNQNSEKMFIIIFAFKGQEETKRNMFNELTQCIVP